MKLTHEYLLQCFDYDPKTGDLIWNRRPESHFKTRRAFKIWNKRFANKKAGTLNKSTGYINMKIDSRSYKAHRIAWFIYYGYLPENEIDHKNRIKTDNWILNLKEANRQCQMRNAGELSNNTSGVKGVSLYKRNEKWCSYITINKKRTHLGYFENFDDAVLKRWEGEKLYKFPNCCTSSSAYNYLKQKGLI